MPKNSCEPKMLRKKKGVFYPVRLIHGGTESLVHVEIIHGTIVIKDQWLDSKIGPNYLYSMERTTAKRLGQALLDAVEDTKRVGRKPRK